MNAIRSSSCVKRWSGFTEISIRFSRHHFTFSDGWNRPPDFESRSYVNTSKIDVRSPFDVISGPADLRVPFVLCSAMSGASVSEITDKFRACVIACEDLRPSHCWKSKRLPKATDFADISGLHQFLLLIHWPEPLSVDLRTCPACGGDLSRRTWPGVDLTFLDF